MQARSKIILDRLLAKPLAFLLNLIVWPLGKIIHRNHSDLPQQVKVIAIAKLLGMGSILRATPLLKTLRKKYPHARYIFITTLKNKVLIEHILLIHKGYFICDDSLFTLFKDIFILLFNLWKEKIDLYFDLEVYSAFSTILATLSLARNRYGFYRDSTRFRMGLNTHLVYFNEQKHISKIYLQLAHACGIEDMDYKIEGIVVKEEEKLELKKWFRSHNLEKNLPYLVINPNASDLLLGRRWPLDYFVALINALVLDWHHPIFLLGSKEERSYVNILYNRLSEEAKKYAFNIAGELSLGQVMELIRAAKLMITNDSGLYHLASIFLIPVISLWGPVSPQHYASINNPKDFIFYHPEIYCSPCLHKTDFPPCRGNNVCMKSISPKEVYLKACEILGIIPITDTSYMEALYARESQKILDITILRVQK